MAYQDYSVYVREGGGCPAIAFSLYRQLNFIDQFADHFKSMHELRFTEEVSEAFGTP